MKRGPTGREEVSLWKDGAIHAFIPNPLPRDLKRDEFAKELNEASAALTGLAGASAKLPSLLYFLVACIHREAVLSSQIEGTQCSLMDLYDDVDGEAQDDDTTETINYVKALKRGMELRESGLPICSRFICNLHETLLSSGRGSRKTPGEFRKSQNAIGGFYPPLHTKIADCMKALEDYMHDEKIDPLEKAGMAHVQFETIHPFNDGNGRIGRMLIVMLLLDAKRLDAPSLYISLYLKKNRDAYYKALTQVRKNGDWEAWLRFFLKGICETVDDVKDVAEQLSNRICEDEEAIKKNCATQQQAAVSSVYEQFLKRPSNSDKRLKSDLDLAPQTIKSALEKLESLSIIKKHRERRGLRVYRYTKYLDILRRDTEPL